MLELKDLKKVYGASTPQAVLNGITLTIQKGEFVVVMGESGSGKSTFLNCISSLDKPSAGEVVLEGKNILQCTVQQTEQLRLHEYGFIFQDNHLIETLTILENIVISRLQYDKQAYSKGQQLLEQLGIGALKDRYPHQISGGEKQRAAVARALMNEPKVLFADEPTASLNPHTANDLILLLEELNRKGQTIIMVTHSMRMASYGTRLLVLVDGLFQLDLAMKEFSLEEKSKLIHEKVSPFL